MRPVTMWISVAAVCALAAAPALAAPGRGDQSLDTGRGIASNHLDFDHHSWSMRIMSWLHGDAGDHGDRHDYGGHQDQHHKGHTGSHVARTFGAPGPIAGAGLPALVVAGGYLWFVRRRRRNGLSEKAKR